MPADRRDPFDTLGLEPRFDLDTGAVERAYLRLAAAAHPDVVGDDAEAARRTAEINDARAVLLDPERRAEALLLRLGGPAKNQDKSLPPDFLGEMMDLRETIEAAIAGDGDAERATWRAWALGRRAEFIAGVGAAFAALASPAAETDLRAIRTRLNAWRYFERLIEQLDPEYDPRRADFGP